MLAYDRRGWMTSSRRSPIPPGGNCSIGSTAERADAGGVVRARGDAAPVRHRSISTCSRGPTSLALCATDGLKLHYLNPVPLHEVYERWIEKFERPRLRKLSRLKRRAEATMVDRPTFVYVTYIEATPERVWHALTDADLRGVLGTRQRVGLAGRLTLGAPAHRRHQRRRRCGHGRREHATHPPGDDVGSAGRRVKTRTRPGSRSTSRPTAASSVSPSPTKTSTDEAETQPQRLVSGSVEPQVPHRDGAHPPASAVGDGGRPSQRPGVRCLTSCTSQPLPSGSLKSERAIVATFGIGPASWPARSGRSR